MERFAFDYLTELESESIHILREVATGFKNPVILYSIGKDSQALIRLAQKAFYPAPIPFPLLHIDTGFKFPEMIEFRDSFVQEIGAELIVRKNTTSSALNLGPSDAHTDRYVYEKKTKPLLDAIKEFGFDAIIGGSRRDEEKSRAKERIFSYRNEFGVWDPKNQRPELWHCYNTRINDGETMRVFPLSNWTEIDVWKYLARERVGVVPLYFAEQREVVERNGSFFRVDLFVKPKDNEKTQIIMCRYRTLGCSPSTAAVRSMARDIDDIIAELEQFEYSERVGRMIDTISETGMEDKKKEGYF